MTIGWSETRLFTTSKQSDWVSNGDYIVHANIFEFCAKRVLQLKLKCPWSNKIGMVFHTKCPCICAKKGGRNYKNCQGNAVSTI